MPDNLGWVITPGDLAVIRRQHHRGEDTPRMLESCNTCGHPRRMHDLSLGESCSICEGACRPIKNP